jgi:hypothetical protein
MPRDNDARNDRFRLTAADLDTKEVLDRAFAAFGRWNAAFGELTIEHNALKSRASSRL